MTVITNPVNTSNQSFANYDTSKFLLGNNRFDKNNYTDGGTGETLEQGLLLGKVAATGMLVECAPAATDGSQFPIGLLWLGGALSTTLAIDAVVSLEYVNKGEVVESKITFPSGVTIDTVIDSDDRTIGDYLNALGLVLLAGDELTEFDNYE